MFGKIQIFVILSAIVALSNSIELPDYIKTCRKNDPNLNECFKVNGNLAIKTLQYGDVNLGVVPFSGMKMFDTLTVQPLKQLPFKLVINNCKAYGLHTLSLTKANIDLQRRHMHMEFINPEIFWQCEYEAQATVLLGKLVKTSGAYNITFHNGEYDYDIDYDLKNLNGEDYIDIKSHRVVFKDVEITHLLENIESNALVNDLWQQTKPYFVTSDLTNSCSDVGTRVFNSFFKVFPYNQIFP